MVANGITKTVVPLAWTLVERNLSALATSAAGGTTALYGDSRRSGAGVLLQYAELRLPAGDGAGRRKVP